MSMPTSAQQQRTPAEQDAAPSDKLGEMKSDLEM